ncbi:MAG: glucose-6-phosphate isomerase family protein [Candidatus Aenigmatarchaeota archaeon]
MMTDLKINGVSFQPEARMLSEMKSTIYDKKWLSSVKDFPAYWFYRDVYLDKDEKDEINRNDVQFDITIIPPVTFGLELPKTKGHHHPTVSGLKITYPEIYQVISGKALFIFQKDNGKEVFDVVMVQAKKGDIAIIPPNYGHVTINDSSEELRISNIVCRSFSSDYSVMEKNSGASYYKMHDQKIIRNSSYSKCSPPRFLKPVRLDKKENSSVFELIQLAKQKNVIEFLTKPKDLDYFEPKIIYRIFQAR